MRKVILICDRCGKQYDKWDHKRPELYGIAEICHDNYEPHLDIQKDLCEECYQSLIRWYVGSYNGGGEE